MDYEFNNEGLTVPVVENTDNIGAFAHDVRFTVANGKSLIVRKGIEENEAERTTAGARRYFIRLSHAELVGLGISRRIGIAVRTIAGDGGEGDWATMPDAFNPPPPKPAVTFIASANAALINITDTAFVSDFDGYEIHVSTSATYNPATGSPTEADWRGGSFPLELLDDNPRFVWVATKDSFGTAGLIYSDRTTVSRLDPSSLIDVQPILDQLEATKEELVTQVDEVVATDLLSMQVQIQAAHTYADTLARGANGVPVRDSVASYDSRLTTVEDEQEAFVQSVTSQLTGWDGRIALVEGSITTVTNAQGALTTSVNSQLSSFGTSLAGVQTATTTNANDIAAETSARTAAVSAVGNDLAAYKSSNNTAVSNLGSTVSSHTGTLATYGGNISSLQTDTQANATAISTETSNRTSAVSTVSGNLASYITSNNTRSTALETLTSTHTSQISSQGSSLASHDTRITTATNGVSTQAGRIDQIVNTTIPGVQTSVTNEVNTRTSADSALGTRIDNLTTTVNGNRSLFDSQVQLQADNHSAQGTLITNLSSRVGTAEGNISSLQSVTSNGTFASASSVNTISARLNNGGDVFASIQNAYNVGADAWGRANATWGLTSNVNGLISGIQSNNNGAISRLDFMASRIRFMNDGGDVAVSPLEIVNGRVRLRDTEVNGNLIVTGTITTPVLANNSVTVIDSVSTTNTLTGQGSGGYYYNEYTGEYDYYSGKMVALSYTINLAYPAKLICISSFTHAYVSSGSPGFNYDISVNGGGIIATGGEGVRVVGSSVSGHVSLPPGTHTVTTNWEGATSAITMNSANLVIMAVYK